MVKVVCIVRNNQLELIRIEGHAECAPKGSDIVCAGISSVVEGSQSFFKNKYQMAIIISKNKLGTTFSVVDHSDELLQACLQMFVHQLRNISHFYPDYVVVCFG